MTLVDKVAQSIFIPVLASLLFQNFRPIFYKYRVALKKSRTLRTITVRILYGEKFPFVHLQISMGCYLCKNCSYVVKGASECRLMT